MATRARTGSCGAMCGSASVIGGIRATVSWNRDGAGRRAGRFRRRPGLHQGSSGEGALPGGGVPVFEHALGGRAARGERRMRVRGSGDRVRAYRPGAARAGVRPTPPAPRTGSRGTQSPSWTCSDGSSSITGSRPGSATRPAAGRRATRRTRSGSSGATSWSPCPTRNRTGNSPPGCSRAATGSPGTRITARMSRSRTCSPGRRRACRRCPGSRTTRAVG